MSNNWINFLNLNGASFNTEKEVTFSSTTPEESTLFEGDLFITDLSWLGVIAVSGDDSKTFLQGQLTNDINAITPEISQLSGLCTPKGRLKAQFSIFSDSNKLYLQLPFPLIEETLKRLKMFVMMSKVDLVDVSDSLIKIGIYGTKAESCLLENGFSIPDEVNSVTQHNDMQLIRLHGDKPRFECVGTSDAIQNLFESLHKDARYLNTEHWKLLDIYAGIPNVFTSSRELFIPQMLNLQVLDGINFKKGCYTGQEIVARMQYLGKLKRRMYRAHFDAQTLPAAGDLLYSKTSKSGQGSGNIVDAQISPDGGIDLLAVITADAVENNDIFLDKECKTQLSLKEIPYTVNTEE
ncbi:MAG: folate-binding protein [gamma proteobacterium symbiont of Lucinoma myriamae]|nr:folate-binding protein [gamma proteobacterium symbiont of Lucinoma myriamae]MCU7817401.1 folate-binding protein [gamma proteobacterium symbiont of Lucinoma myriamae]MCU7832548.1 folate-binding protein [gamma proteobacterium symbiont of Lucinoma myriamae]